MSENQGNALRQDFVLFMECENMVLIRYGHAGLKPMSILHEIWEQEEGISFYFVGAGGGGFNPQSPDSLTGLQ